jgi:hypothetical protein
VFFVFCIFMGEHEDLGCEYIGTGSLQTLLHRDRLEELIVRQAAKVKASREK